MRTKAMISAKKETSNRKMRPNKPTNGARKAMIGDMKEISVRTMRLNLLHCPMKSRKALSQGMRLRMSGKGMGC